MSESIAYRALAPTTLKQQRQRGASRIEDGTDRDPIIKRAEYTAWLVEREDELELASSEPSKLVCFRYKPHRIFGFTDSEVQNLNREILINLHTSGTAGPSDAALSGWFVLGMSETVEESPVNNPEQLIREVLYWGRVILGRRAKIRLG